MTDLSASGMSLDPILNGVTMRLESADACGAVSPETLMVFEQKGQIVSARYRGGAIADGYLVGHITGAAIIFRYVQVEHQGRLDAGSSTGMIDRLPDGRLRLTEHFEWQSRAGTGTNVFHEVSEGQGDSDVRQQ